MTYFPRHNRVFLLVIFCLTFFFAACSSGGKGKGSNNSDTTPDAFTLTAPTGVDLTKVSFSTPITSSPVTINGITGAAPVSISGGEFSVAGGAFASTSRTVSNGQTVTVRVQSPAKADQSATATLNVGGVTAAFTVTTLADTVAPEVAILFPPPASMTEGQTLFLRGTVKDVHGTLAEGAVTVNGVEAELELNTAGDEGTWTVSLDLAVGENTLIVTAADAAENVNDEESVSSRRVADISGESFPDNQNPFGVPTNADIAWVDGKPVAYITDRAAPNVIKTDLTTGSRTVLADNEGIEEDLAFVEPWGIHFGANEKLYVSDFTKGAIFEIDPATGVRTLVAASDEESFWDSPTDLLHRAEEGQQKLYVADQRGKVFEIDLATKAQTLIVNSREGLQPGGQLFSSVFGLGYLTSQDAIVVAATNGIFLFAPGDDEQYPLMDSGSDRISAVAVAPGDDEIYYVNNTEDHVYILNVDTQQAVAIAGGEINGAENLLVDIWGMVSRGNLGYLLLVDRENGLIAMDHSSKHRVIVSKSVASE